MVVCAISGLAPVHPVVSIKSGHVFEQSVIEKYVESTGKCPMTNESLDLSDLLKVQTTGLVTRTTTATSIPGMLTLFQNEWDSLMLECFALKQQLDTVRQELGRALYEHDAACRVIGRLIKERDDARQALAELQMQPSKSAGPVETPAVVPAAGVEPTGITAEVAGKFDATAKGLSKGRKKRAMLPGYVDAAGIAAYSAAATRPGTHPAGSVCIDAHPSEALVASGGEDGSIVISAAGEQLQTKASFKAGKKRLSAVRMHPTRELVLSSSEDGSARLNSTGGKLVHTFSVHQGSVTGCTLHATGDYAVTASSDRSWALVDLEAGSCVLRVNDNAASGYTCASFHPDGLILATGMDKVVRVWEVKSQTNAATFEGHSGAVSCLAFSENGYFLATGAADSTVRLWDLRKLSNFQTIQTAGPVSSLAFDYSGNFLTFGCTTDLSVYETKGWSKLVSFSDEGRAVTGVCVGPKASFLACGTSAGAVALYSAS